MLAYEMESNQTKITDLNYRRCKLTDGQRWVLDVKDIVMGYISRHKNITIYVHIAVVHILLIVRAILRIFNEPRQGDWSTQILIQLQMTPPFRIVG